MIKYWQSMDSQWSEIFVPEGFPPCRYIIQVTLGNKFTAFEANVAQSDSLFRARLRAYLLFYLQRNYKYAGKKYAILGVRILDSRGVRAGLQWRKEDYFLGGFSSHRKLGGWASESQSGGFVRHLVFWGGLPAFFLWFGVSALTGLSVLGWVAAVLWLLFAAWLLLPFFFGS